MTKKEFVHELMVTTKEPRDVCEKMVKAYHELITRKMVEGESVVFSGFGTYSTTVRPERNGVSPIDGSHVVYPEVTVIKFKPSKTFRSKVKE